MNTRKVTSVASDNELVRMAIYDGDIPLGEAGGRLLELALAEHHRNADHLRLTGLCFERIQAQTTALYEAIHTPWPVRWVRWTVMTWRQRKIARKAARQRSAP